MEAVKLLALTVAVMGQNVSNFDPAVRYLATGVNGFSQDLYKQIGPRSHNIVYSPYGIHSALTLVSFGARGETAYEMTQYLRLQHLSSHIPYHTLMAELLGQKDVKVEIAFSLIYKSSAILEPEFTKDLKATFWSIEGNLKTQQESVAQAINHYIAEKTENHIGEVLSSDGITEKTSLLLVNAVYFMGSWLDPFSIYDTRKRIFQQVTGHKKSLYMMIGDKKVFIKRDNNSGVDVVELTLRDARFGFYIALPQKINGIDSLERLIVTPEKTENLFEDLTQQNVRLVIPKFKIESHFDVREPLQRMGFQRSFTYNYADFSGISKNVPLYLSNIFHGAVVDVEESGLTATAATVVSLKSHHAAAVLLPPNEKFVADHPFLFFLRDKLYGEILFQGKFSG